MQIQTTTLTAPALLDKAHQDLKKACRQFDAYFTDLMLKEMRKTVPQGGLLGGQSNQRDIFQSMMDQSLADNMSQHGALGQMMYEELAPSLGTGSETIRRRKPEAGRTPPIMTDRGPITMTDAKHIAQLLRQELKLQTRHCKVLEGQQRALIACDHNQFRIWQEEYTALLGPLEAQAQARQAAMQDEQGQPVTLPALMETMSAPEQATLAALRDTLKRTLERAQALCRRNTQLIQNELNYIAFSLDLFVEAGRQADVKYGGSGWGGRKLLDRRA